METVTFDQWTVRTSGYCSKAYLELDNARELARGWRDAGMECRIVGAKYVNGEWLEGDVSIDPEPEPETAPAVPQRLRMVRRCAGVYDIFYGSTECGIIVRYHPGDWKGYVRMSDDKTEFAEERTLKDAWSMLEIKHRFHVPAVTVSQPEPVLYRLRIMEGCEPLVCETCRIFANEDMPGIHFDIVPANGLSCERCYPEPEPECTHATFPGMICPECAGAVVTVSQPEPEPVSDPYNLEQYRGILHGMIRESPRCACGAFVSGGPDGKCWKCAAPFGWDPCNVCDSYGEMRDGSKCPACNGAGEVARTEPEPEPVKVMTTRFYNGASVAAHGAITIVQYGKYQDISGMIALYEWRTPGVVSVEFNSDGTYPVIVGNLPLLALPEWTGPACAACGDTGLVDSDNERGFDYCRACSSHICEHCGLRENNPDIGWSCAPCYDVAYLLVTTPRMLPALCDSSQPRWLEPQYRLTFHECKRCGTLLPFGKVYCPDCVLDLRMEQYTMHSPLSGAVTFCAACDMSPCGCGDIDEDYLVTACNLYGKDLETVEYLPDRTVGRHADGSISEWSREDLETEYGDVSPIAPDPEFCALRSCWQEPVKGTEFCSDHAELGAVTQSPKCAHCGEKYRETGRTLCIECDSAPVPHFHVYMDIGGGYMPDNVDSVDTLEDATRIIQEWINDMGDCYAEDLEETDRLRSQPDYEYDSRDYSMHVSDDGTYAELTGGYGFVRRCYAEQCDDKSCEAYGSDSY